MADHNYSLIRKFALDYMNLHLILLNSVTMKLEYQNAISAAIDAMREYGQTKFGLKFDGDRINWKASFPESYSGEGDYSIEWLANKGV